MCRGYPLLRMTKVQLHGGDLAVAASTPRYCLRQERRCFVPCLSTSLLAGAGQLEARIVHQ